MILGKAGLSEWANSFGSQPSGFSNLTGQVLNAIDSARDPAAPPRDPAPPQPPGSPR